MDYNDIISNVKIYDLEESLIASGYPMRTKKIIHDLNTQDFERGERLVKATLKGNTAHHQFLTGIRLSGLSSTSLLYRSTFSFIISIIRGSTYSIYCPSKSNLVIRCIVD